VAPARGDSVWNSHAAFEILTSCATPYPRPPVALQSRTGYVSSDWMIPGLTSRCGYPRETDSAPLRRKWESAIIETKILSTHQGESSEKCIVYGPRASRWCEPWFRVFASGFVTKLLVLRGSVVKVHVTAQLTRGSNLCFSSASLYWKCMDS
jgi:hypothetical protein